MDVFVGSLECETEKKLKEILRERFLNVTNDELEQTIRGALKEKFVEITDGKIVNYLHTKNI